MLLIPNLAMAESYLCIAEAAGGIKFDENTYKPLGTSFEVTQKYIIKKTRDEWQVQKFGEKSIFSLSCEARTNFIDCKNIMGGDFIISTNKLRYFMHSVAGWSGPYMVGDEKYNHTPYVEVGSCSEI